MSNAEHLRDRAPVDGNDEARFGSILPKLLSDVAREQTTSAVASRIATSFVLALKARTARVYLADEGRAAPHLAACEEVGVASSTVRHSTGAAEDLLAATAIRVGLVQMSDVAVERAREGGTRGGVAVAVPLFAGTTTIGAVTASFDELALRDCAALSLLSASLGAIVEGARNRGELAQLEEAVGDRDERMSLILHDLREPLQVLTFASSRLAHRSAGHEQRSFEALRSASRRLNGLLSDLSDASSLESGGSASACLPLSLPPAAPQRASEMRCLVAQPSLVADAYPASDAQ